MTNWSTIIQPATAVKPAVNTEIRAFLPVMAKAASMTPKKPKKNLASGFSTGAPDAIGNMPT